MTFAWTNLQNVVQKEIAQELGLDWRSPGASLAARYGTPPGTEFIDDAWHALRESWLPRNRPATEALSKKLADRKVGNTLLRLTSHDKRLEYLGTCRLSKAVREEALEVFLSANSSPSEPEPGSTVERAIEKARREGRPVINVSPPPPPPPPPRPPVASPSPEPEPEPDPTPEPEPPPKPAPTAEPTTPPSRNASEGAPGTPTGPPVPRPQPGTDDLPPATVDMPPVDIGVAGITTEFDQNLHHVIRSAITALGSAEVSWLVPIEAGAEWWASAAGPSRLTAHPPRESGRYIVTDIDAASSVWIDAERVNDTLTSDLSGANGSNGIAACLLVDRALDFSARICTFREAEEWQAELASVALVASAASAFEFARAIKSTAVAGPIGTRSAASDVIIGRGWRVAPGNEHSHKIPSISAIQQLLASVAGIRLDERATTTTNVVAVHPGPNLAFERRIVPWKKKSDDQEFRLAHRDHPLWGPGVHIELTVPSDFDRRVNENLAFQSNVRERALRDDTVIWGGWSGGDNSLSLFQFLPLRLFRADVEHGLMLIENFVLWSVRRGNAVALEILKG